MSEVKWIKVFTNVFDNRKIRQIEVMPEGDAILVIWFKILCLAGMINDEGKIYITQEVPYTDQMLAAQFARPITTIQLALNVLSKFEMIEIVDDILKVSNWEKYQNIEGMDKIREQTRKRVERYRQRQLEDVTQCNVTVTEQKEERREKKEERRKEEDIGIINNSSSETKVSDLVEEWNKLSDLGIKPITKLSSGSKRYESAKARIKQYGFEAMLKAIRNIRESDFLQGNSRNGWTITFDWFVLPNNFPKVLEGNYSNKTKQSEPDDDWGEKWMSKDG